MTSSPEVSVVIATYNRPDVLLWAVRSVLNSTFGDFELLVVGDACSGPTVEAMARVEDKRVRFLNLPRNSGGQSGPNNAGVSLARGRYVMFLNQDDLYFADHISRSVSFMEKTQADIGYSPVAVLHRSGRAWGPPDPTCDLIGADGVTSSGFDPRVFVIASSWIVRRAVCDAVGPWLPAELTRLSPSQEWLFRAWRQGRSIACDPYISVLCIHAGVRRSSYLRRSEEHERAWTWIAAGPTVAPDLLQCMTLHLAALAQDYHRRLHAPERRLARLVDHLIEASRHIGLNPVDLRRRWEGMPKGGWVAEHRRFTSQAPELQPGDRIRIGETAGEMFLGAGWHGGEGAARWTKSEAEIVFRAVNPERAPLWAVVEARPLRAPETLSVSGGATEITVRFESGDPQRFKVPLGPRSGDVAIRFKVEGAVSPRQLLGTEDERILGISVSSLELEGAE